MHRLVLSVGLLAVAATAANAQFSPPRWEKEKFPYAQRHHSVCQEKARRLFDYERRASADGRLSRSERATMDVLRRDLDRTCGRFRWRG